MSILCCKEKESVFGKTIEEMLDYTISIKKEEELVPLEIQQFITYLSERNAIQFKELFINSVEVKKKNKFIKKINKAGTINLKDVHDLHLVISVFIEFLTRIPGRIISKEMFYDFPVISEEGKKKDIKKIKKGLKTIPEQRFATLKYLMTFFSGNSVNNNCRIKIDTRDLISLAPIIASTIIEIPNDYTLSSKIYKNGNVISYPSNQNSIITSIKNRENITRLMMQNFSKIFSNEKEKKKSKPFNYNFDEENYKYCEHGYDSKYINTRSCSICESPRLHMRISSKKCSTPSSPINDDYDSISIEENKSKYNKVVTPSTKTMFYDSDSSCSNKNNFDVQNINYKVIGDKIYLSFTVITPDSSSQNYKLEFPSSGSGIASITNLDSDDSSPQLYKVTSFTDKSSDSTIDNPKNVELKLNLPVFQEKKFRNSNSFLNINYLSNNIDTNKYSVVVQPDESVITELQLFLKATRRYLYDLQSFPTGQIKELFKFSKQRYKLVKEVLSDSPYINLEPIINSSLFGPNKCFVYYEGLSNLSHAQKTLMEYDLFKKNNNIKEFIFQKSKEQCKIEKDLLYQKLVDLKNDITTENDRHILHELNKVYNNIRENLKK
ncbi:Rho GTPase activation protein [Anaeromyces robustus]|uniref:Rho GTPase activation protein n=1 Tax=Anaeromyces robustus TaxID=1754192 RepID=A0A1Y1XJW5_9FUNG|nr:Rho GTPase activation protein [Anaeromyces robustus]|eukprot:ORX86040.1 Rho GTPase activation protein [Anaeromyces robustus]